MANSGLSTWWYPGLCLFPWNRPAPNHERASYPLPNEPTRDASHLNRRRNCPKCGTRTGIFCCSPGPLRPRLRSSRWLAMLYMTLVWRSPPSGLCYLMLTLYYHRISPYSYFLRPTYCLLLCAELACWMAVPSFYSFMGQRTWCKRVHQVAHQVSQLSQVRSSPLH